MKTNVNLQTINGTTVSTGNGSTDSGTLRVTMASSGGTGSMNISQWGGTNTTLGQKVMSSSIPIAIASNQSALTVSDSTSQGILTNIEVNTSDTAASSADIVTNTGDISNKLPSALGQHSVSESLGVCLANNQLVMKECDGVRPKCFSTTAYYQFSAVDTIITKDFQEVPPLDCLLG